MARVYLSFLGTNDYLSCCYFKNDKKLENVRFVQQATLKFFCDDWTLEDRILIFTTDEAYRKNWLNDGHQDHEG
ncbi:MAG: TIGR02221 family CRISPR-associated protein, partial [Proteobacteria bacterium]|nr:TIGR02221 family CRISPR-associated protein [Pseudomonadota bacterium]